MSRDGDAAATDAGAPRAGRPATDGGAAVDVAALDAELETLSAPERLDRAVATFDDVVVASSFGLEDVAILDILYRELGHQLPVVFLDTLHHFDETLALVDRFEEQYGLDLRVERPPEADSRDEFAAEFGERLWERDVEEYHRLTKLRQIDEALEGRDAWITGIRRGQSDTRADADVVEWDASHGLAKINPLVDWILEDVEAHVREHEVPYNPLHDEGYLSIGDEPLTTPTEGDDERSGRWAGSDKTECGLHE